MHETTGKRARVSAVSMGMRRHARERGERGQHGEPVLDVNLGSGGLGEEPGLQRPCGSGSALLAVHERGWGEGEVLGWRGVVKLRGLGVVFIAGGRSMVDRARERCSGHAGSP